MRAARAVPARLAAPVALHAAPPREGVVKETPPLASAGIVEDVLAHVDALHHFARYLTRDAAHAEDLVQETVARCLSGKDRFVPGTNLRAWAFRILRNAFIDSRRREQANPARRAVDAADAPDDERHDVEPLRGDAEMERLRRIVAEDIESAMRALPEDYRTAILLDLEGLTEAEIAAVMECAVGTVKSRLSRARAALRRRLKDYER